MLSWRWLSLQEVHRLFENLERNDKWQCHIYPEGMTKTLLYVKDIIEDKQSENVTEESLKENTLKIVLGLKIFLWLIFLFTLWVRNFNIKTYKSGM